MKARLPSPTVGTARWR